MISYDLIFHYAYDPDDNIIPFDHIVSMITWSWTAVLTDIAFVLSSQMEVTYVCEFELTAIWLVKT